MTENKKVKILVPTDFTEVGDNAIRYANVLAATLEAQIYILHIVSDEEELIEAREKVKKIADDNEQKTGIVSKGIVRIGSIFEDITKAALELETSFIVMGTHGMRGIQKLIGSYAMRVIKDSEVPFFVVQKKPPSGSIKNIVVPVDMSAETKVKFSVVSQIASKFNARIHIVHPPASNRDEEASINANVSFARRFFFDKGNEFVIYRLEGGSDLVGSVVKYAENNNCDLIAAVNTFEGEYIPLFGIGIRDIQKLITNEPQIPVLVVNYRRGNYTYSIFET